MFWFLYKNTLIQGSTHNAVKQEALWVAVESIWWLLDDYYDITEDDDTVSKLLSGSQNIAPDIVRAAATIDPHLVEQYFEREIIHRLNPNKKKHIVLALKELILTDSDINLKHNLERCPIWLRW